MHLSLVSSGSHSHLIPIAATLSWPVWPKTLMKPHGERVRPHESPFLPGEEFKYQPWGLRWGQAKEMGKSAHQSGTRTQAWSASASVELPFPRSSALETRPCRRLRDSLQLAYFFPLSRFRVRCVSPSRGRTRSRGSIFQECSPPCTTAASFSVSGRWQSRELASARSTFAVGSVRDGDHCFHFPRGSGDGLWIWPSDVYSFVWQVFESHPPLRLCSRFYEFK